MNNHRLKAVLSGLLVALVMAPSANAAVTPLSVTFKGKFGEAQRREADRLLKFGCDKLAGQLVGEPKVNVIDANTVIVHQNCEH
ncbi:hypothetical protein [Stenotrophomonas sp. CFBP 13718]|uniref:hypothetical protein n=1 Tax=Stenotrophomonas sp. CFBP 13718 TaxID=2775304 RepID=UPI001782BDD0|nr:hypothetical protein [Stenotrophomonas sp. CFBP 13718]MBD8697973.1 hypothetical protein [Stenotrophomonas sp. CFBP 13718]